MPARQDTEAGGCPTLAGVCIVRCGDHPDRLGNPLLDVPSFFGPHISHHPASLIVFGEK
jgi:hypothetical protein